MDGQAIAEEPAAREEFVDELAAGTRLLKGQYTITRFLNHGGFGITYQARDSLGRDVVIKECFPGSFCRRSNTIVGARSRAHQGEFRSIVKLFVQEALNLSKLVHPNIVGVHQVFEDNDTAYMAIDYVDGRDLLDMIEDPATEIAPERIVAVTRKMLDAVGFVHEKGILHRDISPDNILIDARGEPILIDFGAAREEATRKSRALSALRVVKDGYSPQEFYIAGSDQGPWSDLYALGASIYHAVSGRAPANSQVRLAAIAEGSADPYEPLAGRHDGYPAGFLEAVDQALNVLPRNRIQSAGDWLALLDGAAAVSVSAAAAAVEAAVAEMVAEAGQPEAGQPEAEAATEEAATEEAAEDRASAPAGRPAGAAATRPARRGLLLGAAVAAIAAAIGVATMTGREPAAAPAPAAVAETEAAAEAETAVAAAETVAPEAAEPAPAAAAAAPAAAGPAPGQISYALWDVALPFEARIRSVGSTRFAQIGAVAGDADPGLTEGWLTDGTMIFELGGRPVAEGADLAAQILRDMAIGADGQVAVALRVKAPGARGYDDVALAVPALRRIGLANAVALEARMAEGGWRTVVTAASGAAPELQPGDVLLRETATGLAFDSAEAAERLMEALVGRGLATARFEVERAGQTVTVTMELVPAG